MLETTQHTKIWKFSIEALQGHLSVKNWSGLVCHLTDKRTSSDQVEFQRSGKMEQQETKWSIASSLGFLPRVVRRRVFRGKLGECLFERMRSKFQSKSDFQRILSLKFRRWMKWHIKQTEPTGKILDLSCSLSRKMLAGGNHTPTLHNPHFWSLISELDSRSDDCSSRRSLLNLIVFLEFK
jgi:hypothetical protein